MIIAPNKKNWPQLKSLEATSNGKGFSASREQLPQKNILCFFQKKIRLSALVPNTIVSKKGMKLIIITERKKFNLTVKLFSSSYYFEIELVI